MNKTILAGLFLLPCLSACTTDKQVPFVMELPPVCAFPDQQFPEDMVVLGVGALGGKKIDFQIDQSGNESTQIDVAVNYPDKPVALMLGASEPTIWNIGWTKGTNIVAVFASGYDRQRVAGVKKHIPVLISTYENKGACGDQRLYKPLYLHEYFVASFGYGRITDVDRAEAEQKLSQILFSRPISRIYSVPDQLGKVVVGDPILSKQQLLTSNEIPPRSFYDKNAPLAGKAGLDQAVQKNILRPANSSDAEKWMDALKRKYERLNRPVPDIQPDLFNAYVVLKDFTCPAGLYGGHLATFYVPEGGRAPMGNCGHSKIYDLNSVMLECKGDSPCGQAMMGGAIGAGSAQQIIIIDPAQ